MRVTFHEEKRTLTIEKRGLDFAHAARLFEGAVLTIVDDREEYGETRYQTIGILDDAVVMVVWTPRRSARHIISMRKCNDREKKKYREHVDRSG